MKPRNLCFCFRRVDVSCVISKLQTDSRLTRIKAEFPMVSSHSGLEGSKSVLIMVGKSGIFSITQKFLALQRQKYALLLLNSKSNEEETNHIRKRAGEQLSSLPGCIQYCDSRKTLHIL